MASMGLKYLAWAKQLTEPDAAVQTYSTGKVLGKMVSLNVTFNNAEGELYADDALTEYASEFSSADISTEVDNISLENQAEILGATYDDDDGYSDTTGDNAPYGCIGGYQVMRVSGAQVYRAWWFAKVRASLPDMEGSTRSGSISFGTQALSLKAMAPKYGAWRRMNEFSTEAAAKAWVDTRCNISTT